MLLILVTFIVFHLDISGKDINELHLENIPLILVTFVVFHLDISGKDINELQLENILSILVIFVVFHLDISGKDIKFFCPSKRSLENISLICFWTAETKRESVCYGRAKLFKGGSDACNSRQDIGRINNPYRWMERVR